MLVESLYRRRLQENQGLILDGHCHLLDPGTSDNVREVLGVESITGDTYDRILGRKPHPVQRLVPYGLAIDYATDGLVFCAPYPVTGGSWTLSGCCVERLLTSRCGTIALQPSAWFGGNGHFQPSRGKQRFDVGLLKVPLVLQSKDSL